MKDSLVVGVDIGGSHITAALVDLQNRTIVPDSQVRSTVNSHESAEEIIAIWSQTIDAARQFLPVTKVGIALPGPFDYDKGISLIKDQDKYDSLYGLNVKKLLAARLKINPEDILLKNDAECFLQGEAFSGAASEFDSAVGVTLGTGLGSSTYSDELAGDAGLWNTPFKESIAEDYLSTRWFIQCYAALSGKTVAGVKELIDIIEEDRAIRPLFEEFGRNLEEFLLGFVKIANPQVVVIGGNIMNAHYLFWGASEDPNIIKRINGVPVKAAQLGEGAPLIGAASCWYQRKLV